MNLPFTKFLGSQLFFIKPACNTMFSIHFLGIKPFVRLIVDFNKLYQQDIEYIESFVIKWWARDSFSLSCAATVSLIYLQLL